MRTAGSRRCRTFLAEVEFPPAAQVLDVGCGTGVLTRMIVDLTELGSVVGVDLAPVLLDKARELAADLTGIAFEEADARSLPFADESFDVVVFDSTLSHVPQPEQALAEAARVLRPGGCLAAIAIGCEEPPAGASEDRGCVITLVSMPIESGAGPRPIESGAGPRRYT